MAQGDHKGSLTASVNSVTNPTNLSGSVSVAVGDLVFGVFAQQTALTAAGTVTDNLSNTYSYVNAGTDAGNATIRCFWARVTNAGTLTQVSVPATASTNDASAIASVIEGPFKSSPLDANPANATDGTSPHTCPATGTLAQTSEVVMAACSLASNISMTATSPASLTQAVARANVSCAISRTVVSATTSVAPEFGNGATANAAQTTASFMAALSPLVAAAGSYAFTGTSATVKLGREVAAEAGSYGFSGSTATLRKNLPIMAGAGSYALTGTDASVRHGWEIAADVGSYAFTGTDASVVHGCKVAAGADSYAISGADATLTKSGGAQTLTADAGAYAFNGTAASLLHNWKTAAGADSYAITGTAASPLHAKLAAAAAGSHTITGTGASLLRAGRLAAAAGAYAVSGTDASLRRTLTALTAGAGSYAVTGVDATLSTSSQQVIAAGVGSYAIGGQAATLLQLRKAIAESGIYVVSGFGAGLLLEAAPELPIGGEVLAGGGSTVTRSMGGTGTSRSNSGRMTIRISAGS